MIALHHGRLEPPVTDASLLHASATSEGEAIALWAVEGNDRTWIVTRQSGSATDSITLESSSDWTYPMVQAMPNGGALVASKRCEWVDGFLQKNARHVSADGDTLNEATLGDGINHMLTDANGNVWVGFFDEGVYGDVGWEGEGHEFSPIGGPGLLRFDDSLTLSWSYSGESSGYYIDDCYALNVTDSEAITCFYSDFVIAKVGREPTKYWKNEVAGASALLVSDRLCALVGGYAGDGTRLAIGHFESNRFVVDREERLDTRALDKPAEQAWVVGRGPELHLFQGLEWSRWTLGESPTA